MIASADVRSPAELIYLGPDPRVLRVGVLVPLSGVLGLVGPSELAYAELAAREFNDADGARGRPMELVPIDAGGDASGVVSTVSALVESHLVDALIGSCTSDTRRAVDAAVAGRVLSVFTPPHEGGPVAPGTLRIGESPADQLAPTMRHLAAARRVRRWALIGNDYIWPQAMHATARVLIRALGGALVHERLAPTGRIDPARLVEDLSNSGADAVVLSLIGSDLVDFNRAFAHAGLAARMVRLSGSLEENCLLASGGDDTGGLFAAMRSFPTLVDARHEHLAAAATREFGCAAPPLDAYAEGCYDGVHLVGALTRSGMNGPAAVPDFWRTAPLGAPAGGMHLAVAEGLDLTVVASFG